MNFLQCESNNLYMYNTMKTKQLSTATLLGIALIGSTLLGSCQKENTDRLVLVTEGMGGNQKTYVDGASTYWIDGDRVNINGTTYTISANSTSATISGSFNSGTTYYGVYPASSFHSRTGNSAYVIMPGVYHYNG